MDKTLPSQAEVDRFRFMEPAGTVNAPHFAKYRMVLVAVQQGLYGR
jgi:hypothetical protein